MTHEMYRRVEGKDATIEPCPVCGSAGELWRFSENKDAPSQPVVMCSNGDPIGPRDAPAYEGCLLYMPPNDFYRAREIDAINYWNEFAIAVKTMRKEK